VGDIIKFPGIGKACESDNSFEESIVARFNIAVKEFTGQNLKFLLEHNVPIKQVRNLMLSGAISAMIILDEEILAKLFVGELEKDGN
jgi:hypothetical protein